MALEMFGLLVSVDLVSECELSVLLCVKYASLTYVMYVSSYVS